MNANIHPNDWLSNELKPKISYGSQLLLLFGLIIGGFILAGIIQLGFVLSMMSLKDLMNGDAQKMMQAMAKPENVNSARLMQMFGTLVLMFLPALIFAKIVNGKPLDYLGLKNKFNLTQLGLVIAIAIAALFLSGGLGELNKLIPIPHKLELKFKAMEDTYAEQVMIIGNMKTFADYIISLIMIAILPALFEEILFRGALQKLLVNWLQNPHIAIIITSFLFSAVHASYYGFLPRMGLGLLLGYLYYYSKSIWLNITMHFINNGIAITALYWATQKGQSAKDAMDESYPLWVGGIALIAVVGLMMTYKKVCERKNMLID
jgi:membrane protease YdiL (CAAX protease family)